MTAEFHYLRSTIQREVKRAAGRVEQVEVSVIATCVRRRAASESEREGLKMAVRAAVMVGRRGS